MKKLLKEQSQKISPQEFASRIRKKYPGSYDDMSDIQLTTAMLKKYPQYNDLVDMSNIQNSTSTTTPTTTTPTTTTKVDPSKVSPKFACILKDSVWRGLVQSTDDSNHIMHTVGNIKGKEFHFYGDGKFMYNDISPYKTNIMGTWECDGDSNFIVKTEDDAMFDSKVNKWSYGVNSKPETSSVQSTSQKDTQQSSQNKIPSELKDVKDFQDWLDKNHPGEWHKKYRTLDSKPNRGYGKFGPNTSRSWDKWKNDYLSVNKK